MAYYPISYNLPPSHYEYGYSETIESGTIRNQSGISNFTHNITISVKDPDTGDFVTVSEYKFSAGKSVIRNGDLVESETVSYPQPAVQSILEAIGISFDSDEDILYKDLYGRTFTLRSNFLATQGSKTLSASSYCDDTLTIVSAGTLLLNAPSLAVKNNETNYQNAAVKMDQKSISGLTIGNEGSGNLVINYNSPTAFGELSNSTVSRGGRVEFNSGFIDNCSVEKGRHLPA